MNPVSATEMNKVMVFGVFDGIHQGHRALLKEAKSHGDYLIAVVTQDHVIQYLKGHPPHRNFAERAAALRNEDIVDLVVKGDGDLGSWGVIAKHKPDIIALGYDQGMLRTSLEDYFDKLDRKPTIATMNPHEPDIYHSSLLQPYF